MSERLGSIVFWNDMDEKFDVTTFTTAAQSVNAMFITPPTPLKELRKHYTQKDNLLVHKFTAQKYGIIKIKEKGKSDLDGIHVMNIEYNGVDWKADILDETEFMRNPRLANALEIVSDLNFFRGSDVSQNTIRYISKVLQGVPIRKQGGVYFVPATRLADMDNYVKVLNGAGIGFRYFAIEAEQTRNNSFQLAQAAKESILSDIDELMSDMKELTRRSAIQSRVAEVRGLIIKATNYETLLGCKFDGLKEAAANLMLAAHEQLGITPKVQAVEMSTEDEDDELV